MPPIVLDGTTGITTPGLTNTGTETLVNLTTTGNTILGDASTDTLNVGNGGLIKDASGNVGIGTASPAGKLHVVGSQNAWSEVIAGNTTSAQSYGMRIQAGTTSADTSLLIRDATNTTDYLAVIGNGSVGIGTSSPNRKLYVQSDDSVTGGNVVGVRNSNATAGAFINFIAGGSNAPSIGAKGDNLVFTADGYAGTEWARFSSGNLLVGNTTLGYGSNLRFFVQAPNTYGSGTYTFITYGGSGGSVYSDLGESRVSGGYSTNNGYLVGFRNVFSIGSSTAAHGKLDIYGYTANAGGDVVQTGSYFRIEAGGIITFPQYGAGTLSTNASGVISASDGRFKNKTRSIENGLDAVMQLQPTYYRWKEDCQFYTDHEEIGFIAQEVAAVIPEASQEPEEDPVLDENGNILTVKYKNFHDRAIIAVMVKAIQEQQAIIQSLTARITVLENK